MSWPPPTDVTLVGDVVTLSQADSEHDAAELFAALDDDAVWQHLKGRPSDPAGWTAILTSSFVDGRLPWVVRMTEDHTGVAAGTVVGTTSYLDISTVDARLEIGSTSYSRSVWASGVNPDAKLQLLTYAFEVLGCGRVQLKTDIRNARSQQAIARLGAQYEGVLRRYQRRTDGTVRDSVLFSIVVEEWPVVRDRLRRRVETARSGAAVSEPPTSRLNGFGS
jgi:RimJ/RimL family protein N-acetyltransferase